MGPPPQNLAGERVEAGRRVSSTDRQLEIAGTGLDDETVVEAVALEGPWRFRFVEAVATPTGLRVRFP